MAMRGLKIISICGNTNLRAHLLDGTRIKIILSNHYPVFGAISTGIKLIQCAYPALFKCIKLFIHQFMNYEKIS